MKHLADLSANRNIMIMKWNTKVKENKKCGTHWRKKKTHNFYFIYLPKTDFQDFRLCNELGQDFIKMAQWCMYGYVDGKHNSLWKIVIFQTQAEELSWPLRSIVHTDFDVDGFM